MKKILSITMAVLLLASILALTVLATKPEEASVSVTIADENGEIVLAAEKIAIHSNTATTTIDEMLRKAHEAYYEGGADAGYSSVETEWGISLVKLWGIENGGSYGYCVNNTPATSLLDEVKDGDHLYAYVYTDTVAFSDTYSYFDMLRIYKEKGDTATLTLMKSGYDENWNPKNEPVAGAVITINGEKTDFITDENGKVTITCNKAGTHIISARAEGETLVPPVLVATVEGGTNVALIVAIVALIAVATVVIVFLAKKKQ